VLTGDHEVVTSPPSEITLSGAEPTNAAPSPKGWAATKKAIDRRGNLICQRRTVTPTLQRIGRRKPRGAAGSARNLTKAFNQHRRRTGRARVKPWHRRKAVRTDQHLFAAHDRSLPVGDL